MKNSNIQWIGEIPDDWEVLKNKYNFELSKEIVGAKSASTQLLSLTKNGIKAITEDQQNGKVPASFNTYQVVKKDDIVMCLFDLDVSAVFSGISNYDGMISPAYKCFKCKPHLNPKYVDYYFRAVFVDRKYKRYSKNVRYSISAEEFMTLPILVPPLATQTSIATYLDSKCSEIDGLIADINKQIETLNELKKSTITEAVTKGLNKNAKLKDSGIQWIGMIPEGWSVTKIGFIADTCSGGTPPSSNADFYDGDIKWVCSYDLHEKEILDTEKHLTNMGASMIAGKIQMPNSILIAMYGGDGTIGNSGLLLVKARTNQAVCSIHFDETIIIPLYAFFFIRFLRPFWMYYAQGSRKDPNINQEIVKNMKILIPPLAEQHAIATYLDTKCSEFDSIISDKQKQISTLEAYKKSLIYEYVTGKKEVES